MTFMFRGRGISSLCIDDVLRRQREVVLQHHKGFRVWGFGAWVVVYLAFIDWGSQGCMVWGWGLGIRVWGFGVWVWGLRF